LQTKVSDVKPAGEKSLDARKKTNDYQQYLEQNWLRLKNEFDVKVNNDFFQK
jgi:hypothetical protein